MRGYTRIGKGSYRKLTKKDKSLYKGDYLIGEIGYEISIRLTEKQLDEIEKFAIEIFGEDTMATGIPFVATAYFQIADKTKYDEFHSKVKQQTI